MHEIICPHCSKAFKIDEAGYAEILKQVRDGAFEQQLHERLELAEQDKRNAVELAQAQVASAMQKAAVAKDSEIQALKAKLDAATELAEAKLANRLQNAAAAKDAEVQGLRAKLDAADLVQKLAITEAVNVVARERDELKNGLGLMLVSQRPADIDGTVIAQCGTWLVLRLTNQADQQHVSKFLPDGLSGMTRSLPNLGQQEAIFVGEGAALPARLRIRDLTKDQLPQSHNAKFAEGWSGPRLTVAELNGIAERMAK